LFPCPTPGRRTADCPRRSASRGLARSARSAKAEDEGKDRPVHEPRAGARGAADEAQPRPRSAAGRTPGINKGWYGAHARDVPASIGVRVAQADSRASQTVNHAIRSSRLSAPWCDETVVKTMRSASTIRTGIVAVARPWPRSDGPPRRWRGAWGTDAAAAVPLVAVVCATAAEVGPETSLCCSMIRTHLHKTP
jgi:hypothetical protein